MGFQGAVKLYVFILNRNNVLKLLRLIETFHGYTNDPNTESSFEKWSLICCHMICISAVTFYGCAVLVFCYPIIFYLISGERILHFGFVIPGIDWDSLHGYVIKFLHHTFQIYVVINGLFLMLAFILILLHNGFAQYEALEILLDELSHLAENNKDNKNIAEIRTCIDNLVARHVLLLE